MEGMDRVGAAHDRRVAVRPPEAAALGALIVGTSAAVGPASVGAHAANAATVALLWAAARLLSLGLAGAATAGVAYSLLPGAVELHRVTSPGTLAVLLLVGAQVAVRWPGSRPGRRLIAGEGVAAGLLAGAVLLDPAALLLGPAIGWQRQLAACRPGRPGRGTVVGAGAGAALALGWGILVVVVLRTPVPAVDVDVSATLLVPAAAAVFAVRQRLLRPLAAAVLVLAGAALLDGGQRPSIVAVALPAAALVLAAVLAGVAACLRSRESRRGPAAAPLVAVALAALASPVAAAAGPGAPDVGTVTLDDPAASAERGAVSWIEASLGAEATVAADPALQASATRAGVTARVVSFAAAGPGLGSADFLAVTAATRPAASARAGLARALRGTRLVAAFGAGAARVELRRTRGWTDSAAEAREAAARHAAGADLAANPRLELGPPARVAVLAGAVDPRLLGVLAAFARDHDLAVSAFPAVRGEAATGALRRVARITAVDREGLRRGDRGQEVVESWLAAQRPPNLPLSTVLREEGTSAALEVTFDAATEVRLTGPITERPASWEP
jgi:hypothetical protein